MGRAGNGTVPTTGTLDDIQGATSCVTARATQQQARVRGWGDQLATQCKAFVYYLKLLAIPHPLTVEHEFIEFRFAATAASLVVPMLAAAVFASLLWVLLRGTARAPANRSRPSLTVARTWFAWLLISLLPTAVIPLNVLVSERRIYLATAAGVCIAITLLWGRISSSPAGSTTAANRSLAWSDLIREVRRRSWASGSVALALVILATTTVHRNRTWASEVGLWEDARNKGPGMVRPHLRLGTLLRAEGQGVAAEAAFHRAIEIEPDNAAAFNNLGNLYKSSDDLVAAEQAYQTALGHLPRYAEALINLGSLYSEMGRHREAVEVYERARPVATGRVEFFNNLGTAYLRLRQFGNAEAVLRQGLSLLPGESTGKTASMLRNLGGALEGQGKIAAALDAHRQALAAEPQYAPSHYDLGRLHGGRGEAELAVTAYRNFLRYWRGDQQMLREARRQIEALRAGESSTGGGE